MPLTDYNLGVYLTMHPNLRRLLGLDTPVVFHQPTWPTPVNIPYTPATEEQKS